MNLSKKYKEHDSSVGYIDEYLAKGKKLAQKKPNPPSNTKQPVHDSSKVIKARRLWKILYFFSMILISLVILIIVLGIWGTIN